MATYWSDAPNSWPTCSLMAAFILSLISIGPPQDVWRPGQVPGLRQIISLYRISASGATSSVVAETETVNDQVYTWLLAETETVYVAPGVSGLRGTMTIASRVLRTARPRFWEFESEFW